MLVQIVTENGQKKVIPLTADAGAGLPVGTVIVVCSNQIPSNYLPLGTQYDTSLYPILYALLGTDTTPTASALGLPTLTSGQYAIKATSGLSENAQDNVLAQLNEERSYSTTEINTGKKWIDGKPIYSKTFEVTHNANTETMDITTDINGDYFLVKCDIVTDKFEIQKYQCFGAGEWNNFQIDFISNGGSGTKTIVVKFGQTIKTYNFKLYVTLEYTKTTD